MKNKVYEDENIKLYRDDKQYDVKTKDLSRKINYGAKTDYGMSFNVEWTNVVSQYACEYEFALAA